MKKLIRPGIAGLAHLAVALDSRSFSRRAMENHRGISDHQAKIRIFEAFAWNCYSVLLHGGDRYPTLIECDE
jgi:hypothetical protein